MVKLPPPTYPPQPTTGEEIDGPRLYSGGGFGDRRPPPLQYNNNIIIILYRYIYESRRQKIFFFRPRNARFAIISGSFARLQGSGHFSKRLAVSKRTH